MSKFITMADDVQIERDGNVIQKYNPNHGADGRFSSGGGGGGAAISPLSEAELHLNHFEKKVDKAYGTGEDAFTIEKTGEQSKGALGHYLGVGSEMNNRLRKDDVSFPSGKPYAESADVVGLDKAIDMAPPIPNTLVWRTTSADAIRGLKKGGVYMDKGFTSTTAANITHPENGTLLLTLATVTNGKKAIMEINTGKGKGIYMPKMFPGQPIAEFEKEFLMPRNTKMKYLGVDMRPISGGNWIDIHRFKVVD
jgi:hypothetical protein